MKHDSLPIEIHLPTLSDEAAVAIRDFLIECQLSFESRYYAQIQRFRRDRECNDDDPPWLFIDPGDDEPF